MTVGTHLTGDRLYGPRPCWSGTHAGTHRSRDVAVARHVVSSWESQPQPISGLAPVVEGRGLSPTKPSILPATSSICEPQLGCAFVSNVASETVNRVASAIRFGICAALYCVRHAYWGGPQPLIWLKSSILPPSTASV